MADHIEGAGAERPPENGAGNTAPERTGPGPEHATAQAGPEPQAGSGPTPPGPGPAGPTPGGPTQGGPTPGGPTPGGAAGPAGAAAPGAAPEPDGPTPAKGSTQDGAASAQPERAATTADEEPPETPETVGEVLLNKVGNKTAVGAARDDEADADPAPWRVGAGDDLDSRQRLSRFTTSTGANAGAVAVGPYATATQVTVRLEDGRRVTVQRYELADEDLVRIRDCHVRGAGFQPALRTLTAERVVVLRGPEFSGRRDAAHALLAQLWAEQQVTKVAGLDVRDDVPPWELADQRDVFPSKWGVVLELRHGVGLPSTTLEVFRTLARNTASYLVILTSSGTADEPAGPYVVAHEWPDPYLVLQSHLLAQLPADFSDDRVEEVLEHEAIKAHLASYRRPAQVVELAAVLAVGLPRGEEPEELLGRLRPSWRQVARDAFEDALKAEPTATDPFAGPRRQALRAAYAILDGLELVDVLDAAESLLSLLRIVEAPESTPARRVFDDGLDRLLYDGMLEGADRDPQAAAESPRRARLRDPALSDAVLDVAWNDYDTTRVALLIWLDQLVLAGRARVRARAAEAAGKLATYDFEKVLAELIRPWAAHTNGMRRQAAAWALELVGQDPRYGGRVRRRVTEWVAGRDPELHDTAARVYATKLGPSAPETAMTDLRTIAADPAQRPYHSVGRAVATVYGGDSADLVLDRLDRWLADPSPHVPVHATWALVFLAQRLAPPPRDRWPLLLEHGYQDPTRWPVLVRLWSAALAGATTAYPAWELLRQWLELPGDDDELSRALAELAVAVLGEPRLRRRARWHLRLWRRRRPDDELLTRISAALTKG